MIAANSSDIVLVTGAAGFIGAVVTKALADAGVPTRAGSRHSRPAAGEPWPCDLDNPDQISAALVDVQSVVHTAYGSSAAMMQQCKNLLAAMDKNHVTNLIYFSSIAVYGDQTGAIAEDAPLAGLDDYANAKIACEALIQDWVQGGERRAIIVRPGIVYGRNSPFWINKLSERITCGAWGTFGPLGEGTAALIHVDDVASLTVRASAVLCSDQRNSMPAVTIVNVQGPEDITWNAYFSALAEKLHEPSLPELSAQNIAYRQKLALFGKVWRKLALPGFKALALAPTAGEIALFSRKACYRTRKAEDVFRSSPVINLQDGLARSLRV